MLIRVLKPNFNLRFLLLLKALFWLISLLLSLTFGIFLQLFQIIRLADAKFVLPRLLLVGSLNYGIV